MNRQQCLHLLTGVAGIAGGCRKHPGQANSSGAAEQAPKAIPTIRPIPTIGPVPTIAKRLIDNAPDPAIREMLLVDNPGRLFKFT